MAALIKCSKMAIFYSKNIKYLNSYHCQSIHYYAYRCFSKKITIKKKEVMKDWRSKYDRSEIQKDHEVVIPFEKLDISCCRSSGPGGQNVNKVATKVEVRIDLNDCNWMHEDVIERLKIKQRGRVNKDNEFILVCDTHRTQYDNKNEANKRLGEIIEECCYPERERIESSKPKEFQELEKEYKQNKKNNKSQKQQMKSRGW
eukprot:272434_1